MALFPRPVLRSVLEYAGSCGHKIITYLCSGVLTSLSVEF